MRFKSILILAVLSFSFHAFALNSDSSLVTFNLSPLVLSIPRLTFVEPSVELLEKDPKSKKINVDVMVNISVHNFTQVNEKFMTNNFRYEQIVKFLYSVNGKKEFLNKSSVLCNRSPFIRALGVAPVLKRTEIIDQDNSVYALISCGN